MSKIFVRFDDNSVSALSYQQLGRLCFDTDSWWSIWKMARGAVDEAPIKITAHHGMTCESRSISARVFRDERAAEAR